MRLNRRTFLGGSLAATLAASSVAGNDNASPRRTLGADVCVVGGGPAGFVAAIAAARNGVKVTLVESFGFPGGMATAGLVGPISKFNFGGKRVVGGLPWEFVERLAARGGAITDLPKGNAPFEAEVYRRVAREMLEEAGVTCLWQTSVCGAPELAQDGSIRAVTLSTAGFLSRLEAKMFIDCSASGALVGHHGFGDFRSSRAAADVTDPVEIAEATALMRREIPEIVDVMRSADPAFREAYVAQTAAASGFRECRELKALHRVTATEFVSGERPADTIALAAHPMDRHLAGSSGQNLSFLKKPGAIPLSALISVKCPNLLAAGGLVAAEPAAFASIRVQAQCMATGQAAGTAASMSAKAGCSPKDLETTKVIGSLKAQGTWL